MPSYILWETRVAGLRFETFVWHVPNALCSQDWIEQRGYLLHPRAKNIGFWVLGRL